MKLSVIAQSPFIALCKLQGASFAVSVNPGSTLDVDNALGSALVGQHPQAFRIIPDEPKKKKQPVDEYEKKA